TLATAALGPRSLSITTPGGTSNELTINVSATLPPPTLTSVTPNSGHIGQSFPITFIGTNFGGPMSVDGGFGVGIGSLVATDTNTVNGFISVLSNATLG